MMVLAYAGAPSGVEFQKTYLLLARKKAQLFRGIRRWHPDHLCAACAVMTDQLQNRAARLLAMALKAREEGHLDSAERFTQRASEILDQPSALERLGTQGGEKVIEHPEAKKARDKE
jgi:hypothetical protein